MDLRAASKFLAIAALLAGAWVAVRLLKPKEAELPALDSRTAEFGDMSSAAEKRSRSPGAPDDVSGLDMVPSSSLPLSAPEAPPEPTPAPAASAAPPPPPAARETAPAPAPPPRREKPRLERTRSVLEGESASSSAFLAAPEDEKKKTKR